MRFAIVNCVSHPSSLFMPRGTAVDGFNTIQLLTNIATSPLERARFVPFRYTIPIELFLTECRPSRTFSSMPFCGRTEKRRQSILQKPELISAARWSVLHCQHRENATLKHRSPPMPFFRRLPSRFIYQYQKMKFLPILFVPPLTEGLCAKQNVDKNVYEQ